MGISIRSHLYSNAVIAAKFCAWHDSCAVVACAKMCCDLMASNRVMARRSFHRIWIAGKKPLVKRAPGPRFNIKMSSYQHRKSHCGDKTVVRSSYLHNGISYTGKTSFYWIGAQDADTLMTMRGLHGKLSIADVVSATPVLLLHILSYFIGKNRTVTLFTRHQRVVSLQWRHNERDGVWNHRRYDYLLNRLFRRRPTKTPKLRVTGLCGGNPPVTSGFP